MERQPRMSTSSISFRETPELNSTPPAAAGNQFAHAVRNVPTPPGILSSSPTASPARGRGVVVAAGASGAGGLGDGGGSDRRGGTVSQARALARTESESRAMQDRRSTQSQSTLDLVNNMKKLRAQFEQASAVASNPPSPVHSLAQSASPKKRQATPVSTMATVPRAATGPHASHTASSAGDVEGLVRELQELAARGSVESLGQFLAGHPGCDIIDGSPPPHRRTALIIAAAHRRVPHMGVLLDAGADTECSDIHGWTAFHYACSSGCMEATEMLLRAGCNTEATEKNGRSGIALAKEQGLEDIISVLEQHSSRRTVPADRNAASDAVRWSTMGPKPVLQQVDSPQRLPRQQQAAAGHEPASSLTSPLRASASADRLSSSTLHSSLSSTASVASASESTARVELTAEEKQKRIALHRELQRERIARKAAESRNVELEMELKRANTLISELRQRPASAAAQPGGRAGGGSRGDGIPQVSPRQNQAVGGSQQRAKQSNGILALLQNTIRETFEKNATTTGQSNNGLGAAGRGVRGSTTDADSPRDLFKKDNSAASMLTRGAATTGGVDTKQPEQNEQVVSGSSPAGDRLRRPTTEDIDFNLSSFGDMDLDALAQEAEESTEDEDECEDESEGEKDGQEEEEEDGDEEAALSPAQQMAAAKALLSSSGDGAELEDEIAAARAQAAQDGIIVAPVGSASVISPRRNNHEQQTQRVAMAALAPATTFPKPVSASKPDDSGSDAPVKLVAVATPATAVAHGEDEGMGTEDHLALMELQSKFQAMDGEAYQTMMDQHGHDPTLHEVQAALHQLIASDPGRFLEPADNVGRHEQSDSLP